MKIKCAKVFFFFIATAAALFLSGCEMPESWNDPAYFGHGKDLGKKVNGSGTGYETWDPDVL